eukprot:2160253-Amphidinium_carterae.1
MGFLGFRKGCYHVSDVRQTRCGAQSNFVVLRVALAAQTLPSFQSHACESGGIPAADWTLEGWFVRNPLQGPSA